MALQSVVLQEERRALQCAIVVLQARISEIDVTLAGGVVKPRAGEPELTTIKPATLVTPAAHMAPPEADAKTGALSKHNDIRTIIASDDAAVEDIIEESSASERAAQEAAARGEKFIAITDGVRTKRVARLDKLLDPANAAHYNIKLGTKVYAVKPEGTEADRVYLGKYTNLNTKGMPLPNGRIQFLFKNVDLASKYTGIC